MIKNMKKKIIGVTINKELLKKIDNGDFNRSKLIDSLLTKHYIKKNIIKVIIL
jgi:metal-responsive CopG/Arc/MetJ family transcriptional regulator